MVANDRLDAMAGMLAFVGNSVLLPVNRTSAIGLEREFWRQCPDFGDAALRAALDACGAYAADVSAGGDGCAEAVAVEFAHLFVGPPKPAAPPWETAYRTGGTVVGFGEATFEMRRELQAAGLGFAEGRNQYEDHFGIELLLLSELTRRAARGECDIEHAAEFAKRPLGWAGAFRKQVSLSAPDGYYARLLTVAEALLRVAAAA